MFHVCTKAVLIVVTKIIYHFSRFQAILVSKSGLIIQVSFYIIYSNANIVKIISFLPSGIISLNANPKICENYFFSSHITINSSGKRLISGAIPKSCVNCCCSETKIDEKCLKIIEILNKNFNVEEGRFVLKDILNNGDDLLL